MWWAYLPVRITRISPGRITVPFRCRICFIICSEISLRPSASNGRFSLAANDAKSTRTPRPTIPCLHHAGWVDVAVSGRNVDIDPVPRHDVP
jgi:hypothetical protein